MNRTACSSESAPALPEVDADRLRSDLDEALEAARSERDGEPSDYLEDVQHHGVDGLAAAVCTTDGEVAVAGDDDARFALQSAEIRRLFLLLEEAFKLSKAD